MTPHRRATRLAAPLLALGLAAGCASDGEEPATPESVSASPTPSEDATSPEPSVDARALPDVGRYVALGDSYAAAPFVPETERESGCLRSSGNYPSLVAEAVDAEAFEDVSCVGADATSLIGAQPTLTGGVNLPQFDALTPETDLVTLTLGGNDFGVFSRLMTGCLREDADGSPCRLEQQEGGEDALLADLEQTRERLTAVLRGVEDRAPDARVLLVGYPVLVPESGACPDRLPLAEEDYDYVREVNLALNDTLEAAAEATGTTYVDVGAASTGHDICSEEPWVNGAGNDEAQALAFHPLPAGQEAVADLVLEALAQGARSDA